ncbi:hypothetical protein IQ270_16790 [Microcoleus sp. LEGE 07076]|uniref:hypothetical protein n=1 Tax=Microcoleus sp. LEGE 07076 TaxID=915322 RepID=UPI00187DEE57|nr:hypothetical protein [Microcoleus sp. LEGE 07076]MBE9186300.1 hypothetical protein [Microcoleus sp. LEGE 07076]
MPKRSNNPQNSQTPSRRGGAPVPALNGGESNQWLSVSYQPVSLFSLKRSDATSMAARSNLVPTPYAIKMALLKVLLESEGALHSSDFDEWIEGEFAWIRDLQIWVRPPERLVVNRNGYKLRYYDQTADKADKTRLTLPMQGGFVFREWIYLEGNLEIHCAANDRSPALTQLFAQINYFGKRGCFFQYLPDRTQITAEPLYQPNLSLSFTVGLMDDFGKNTTFDKINPFSTKKAALDKERTILTDFLPLKLTATSARYDFYQRL